jgi:hypothetical protein
MRTLFGLITLAAVVSSPAWIGYLTAPAPVSIRPSIQNRIEGNYAAQHTKDPTKCTKVCTPHGWEGELPAEFPDEAEVVTCAGDKCARAFPREPPSEDPADDPCQRHHGCSVSCSEVCCVCLRECI